MTILATWNLPPHSGSPKEYRDDLARLVDRHNPSIICVQERPDDQVDSIAPPGYAIYRPGKAASAAVLFNHHRWRRDDAGTFKVSRKGDPIAPRYIVWARLINDNGRPIIAGSVHLVSGKTDNDKRGKEHDHQTRRCATWLSGKPKRVLLGDFNAEPDSKWMKALRDVSAHHTAPPGTGPKGTPIDHAWTRRDGFWSRPETIATMSGHSDHKALVVHVEPR